MILEAYRIARNNNIQGIVWLLRGVDPLTMVSHKCNQVYYGNVWLIYTPKEADLANVIKLGKLVN